MNLRNHLLKGHVIPAHPLALDKRKKLSERHQRALTRYYMHAGSGGLAVGVHSTQFEIRDPKHGLFGPVLELASETMDQELRKNPRDFIKVAGLCGRTTQAVSEAKTARDFGYHAGLLSLGAWKDDKEGRMIEHCRMVSEIIPLVGFYLQPAVGGRILGTDFWRRFAEIPGVVAIKIAPFNRYQTLDVIRAVVEAGRDDIALYTGNDDNIIVDLLTPFVFRRKSENVMCHIVGGLLGQWGVWTYRAVRLLGEIKASRVKKDINAHWLTRAMALTDVNAAIFDAANEFAGCIPGILEVLWRQGLVPGIWCLNSKERLSPGQSQEIDRVYQAYPDMNDDRFVREHLDGWLK